MRKRPLCLIAVLVVLFLWITPKEFWLKKPDIPSEEMIQLTGTVAKREQTAEKQVYFLKNCRCSRSDSLFSVLAYTEKGNSYPIGCTLSLYGTIYQLNRADNPGQFDAALFYQSQGILYTFQSENERIIRNKKFPVQESAARLREFLAVRISRLFCERDAGILRAVLLGDKSELREDDRILYQKNGISHLLAISGLHISMIGMGMYRLLRKAGASFAAAGIPSGISLLFYGMMTGFGVATARAVCMLLVLILAEILGRTYDMPSAMALAALFLVFRNPMLVWQAGFLLSFGAVLGICAVYPALAVLFPKKSKLIQTFLFSISISFVTYPLSVHFYYEYPLYGIFLNLIAIPCMPFVMGFGALALLGSMVFLPLGKLLAIPVHFFLSLYEFLGTRILKLPLSVLTLGCEKPWQLIAYYLLFLIALRMIYRTGKRRFLIVIFAAVLLVSVRFHSSVEFTVLDVGQGDGLFLRFPEGTTCFIDGGSTSFRKTGQYRILPYLKYEGVKKLDYVIFSHMDADHVNGMEELLEMSGEPEGISIGSILFPESAKGDEKKEKLCALAEKQGIHVETMGAGDEIFEKEAVLRCLFPERGRIFEDKNAGSLVLQFEYREFQLLLTGDLGIEGEKELLRHGKLGKVDVWKVSHHGSNNSGSEEFLEQICPSVSLISVGRKNRYGHPGRELLDRLERIGSKICTTSESGALMIESDGTEFCLFLQRETD